MSSLIRWNPIREMVTLRDEMDRLFNQAFGISRFGEMAMPNVDVIENDDAIVVKAELPGFKPEDVDVRIEGNVLNLRGEYKQENEKQEGQYHVRERRQSSFARSISLPSTVEIEKANAEYENGVLTLTLPKSEKAKPRKIEIVTKKK